MLKPLPPKQPPTFMERLRSPTARRIQKVMAVVLFLSWVLTMILRKSNMF